MIFDHGFGAVALKTYRINALFNKSLPDIATGEASFCVCLFSSQG